MDDKALIWPSVTALLTSTFAARHAAFGNLVCVPYYDGHKGDLQADCNLPDHECESHRKVQQERYAELLT